MFRIDIAFAAIRPLALEHRQAVDRMDGNVERPAIGGRRKREDIKWVSIDRLLAKNARRSD
jgi:hypothetical protein